MNVRSDSSETTEKVLEFTVNKATGVFRETERTNETTECQTHRTSTTTFTEWSELPSELRLAVLDEVAKTDAKRRRFPELSMVCKEWQVFFEGFLYNSFDLLREEEVAYF
ncbi:hypothetical protein N0V92_013816, partial [Colletotrichum tropicale]